MLLSSNVVTIKMGEKAKLSLSEKITIEIMMW
jgi:hypothetical protein